ncbi:MAG: ATP-binding protein [Desulfobacterales bacterium]|nr:ATP-binding protein [Desulfobacterales bacterium]
MLKLKSKFRLLIGLYMSIPLVVLCISIRGTDIFSNLQFQNALGISIAASIFICLCNPLLIGLRWCVFEQLDEISKVCTELKHGRYTFFSLPNEPLDGGDENELIDLMRDMNWMIRKIASRESELEARVSQRTLDLEQTNGELLLARDQANASARAKSEFLATMGHELRTPLNAVLGYTDLLMTSALPSKQEEYVRIIRTASQSLLKIINDILTFSKVDAGKLVVENIPFDLEKIFEETFDLFKHELDEKSLDLSFDMPAGLPRHIMGDPLRLQQVFINLVSNAVKFTQEGGIHIRVDGDVEKDRTTFVFEVQDSGIGMSEQTLSRIFIPFTQADGSTTRNFGGTGLGLAISQKLIHLMGGKIIVHSSPGRGSCFRVELEAVCAPSMPEVQIHGEAPLLPRVGKKNAAPSGVAGAGKTMGKEIQPLLSRMDEQIRQNSLTAKETARSLKMALAESSHSHLAEKLETQLNRFDFKTAGKTFSHLTSQIKVA